MKGTQAPAAPRFLATSVLFGILAASCSREDAGQEANADAAAPAAPVSMDSILISNAHLLDGSGTDIAAVYLLVRDGIIEQISATPIEAEGAYVIDAAGKTLMPGFIDAHRHIIQGPPAEWLANTAAGNMQAFLEAGFTTVFSAGDSQNEILELRRKTAAGEITGPRILAAGRAPLAISTPPAGSDDPARTDVSRPPLRPTAAANAVPDAATVQRIQEIADAGFDAVKTVIVATPDGPEVRTLGQAAQEAKLRGLPTVTHAVTVQDTLAAVAAGGVATLVHTPHIGQLTLEEAELIAASAIPMTSTLGIFVPFFDDNNQPVFRDALPFPWDTIASAGQGPVNARLLWEAGVVYGYGTDTRFDPALTLKHELKSLQLVFSERDIVKIMGENAAINIRMQDKIGALKPGMYADLVLLDGNPLVQLYDLLKVAVVMKDGRIVVDKR